MDLVNIFINLVYLMMVVIIPSMNALMFHLSPNQKKCLKEEIHKDVLVTGEYTLSEAVGQKTDLEVV